MTSERWQQIDKLFESALTYAESERADFLRQACGGDEDLLREVESLLASHQEAGSFIEQPALEAAARIAARSKAGPLIGKTIGSYEVVALLGKGAMGEVYRAEDKRIGREVAIKILPAIFSEDPERLHRFEQEARAAGRLNHPNVLVIHDVGTFERGPFIVSELLEGKTLREHLTGKPLAIPKAIDYASQIARGLAAAHEKGIVHRDLKPENLYITKNGKLKILDFGIAKLQTKFDSTTIQVSFETAPNLILGTVGYMSPEQVRGEMADHRSDIFALGAVLYEMLSGQRAFPVASVAEAMSAILNTEPLELSKCNPNVSATLQQIVHRCLQKSPEQRFQSASDLAFHLETLTPGQDSGIVVSKGFRKRKRLAWITASLLLLLALTLSLARIFKRAPVETGVMRFTISSPDKAALLPDDAPAISPDGRQIVFVAALDGKAFLWLRALESLSSRQLPATEGASAPFWSPDGRFIGFFAGGKLKKIDTSGGPSQTICDATTGGTGDWNRDGDIIFAQDLFAIYRVPSAGGQAMPVTRLDSSRGELAHQWPQFLPDGRRFLYSTLNAQIERCGISIGSLDLKETETLLSGVSSASYSPPGYLLFLRQGILQAQPFDARGLKLMGEPMPVATHVSYGWFNTSARFSASQNGVLAYTTGQEPERQNKQLVWYSREGKVLGLVGASGPYMHVELSPDEKQVVAEVIEPETRTARSKLWLVDLARNTSARFTSNMDWWETQPHWSPDGTRIIYNSREGGIAGLYSKELNTSGKPELLHKGICPPSDWSKDGRFIACEGTDDKGISYDLRVLALSGEGRSFPFLRSEFNEYNGQFSPVGKWMAYTSDESGRDEVYVRSFPGAGPKWRVSTAGGSSPRWNRAGNELYYLATGGKLMVVPMKLGSSVGPGTPKPLFQTQKVVSRYRYTVTGDGQRFLVITPAGEVTPPSITVVLNWPGALKR